MAWLLVICLVLGLLPTALAANAGWPDAAVSADATVTLSSDKADGTPVTIQAGATLVVESDQPGTTRTITYAGTERLFAAAMRQPMRLATAATAATAFPVR